MKEFMEDVKLSIPFYGFINSIKLLTDANFKLIIKLKK